MEGHTPYLNDVSDSRQVDLFRSDYLFHEVLSEKGRSLTRDAHENYWDLSDAERADYDDWDFSYED